MDGMRALEEVVRIFGTARCRANSPFQFDHYRSEHVVKATVDIEPLTAPLTAQPMPLQCYGSTFLMETVNAAQRAELAKSNPRDELIGYLKSPPEQTDNILHWWGVSFLFFIYVNIFDLYLGAAQHIAAHTSSNGA